MKNTKEKIKNFITGYFLEHCYAPSYEEIIESVGISKSNLHRHMQRLFYEEFLVTDLEDPFSKARAYRPNGYKCVKEGDAK